MAKTKKIVLQADVIVDDKGTMKKSAKGAHSVDRRLKGAAKTSSGASKNFSKMAQGITGGLVPAYATLAASVFALDAVYRGLKSAADLRILQQGQIAYAVSTGQAMNVVANAVQRATQMQVSFKEASQASAIAAAAGFGTDQIVALATAANNAAKVLGRSVPDAFDRMVRGVVKAEPEVLDELGIILRLDDAARNYAQALGINKEKLTVYEKSQAVLNEVLAQAESKFAHVADAIDPNPWNQLGVAMEKVKDNALVFISSYLEPVASFLSANASAAVAAMLVFISSILKGLIPSYAAQATAFVASQNAQQLEIDETIAKIKALEAAKRGGTEALGMAEGGIQKIAKSAKGKVHGGSVLGRAQKGEVISARSAAREIKRIEKDKKKYIELLGKKGLKDYKMHLKTITVESKVSVKKVEAGWKTLFLNINLGAKKMALTWKTVMRSMQKVTTIAGRAMSVAMSAMGWISMIYMVVEAVKAWREQNDEAVIAQKKFDEKTANLAKTFSDLDVTMTAVIDKLPKTKTLWRDSGQEVEYLANAMKGVPAQQTIDYLKELGDVPLTDELLEPLTDVFNKMSELVPVLAEIKAGMSTEEIKEYIEQFMRLNAGMQDFAAASRTLTESQAKLNRVAKERADSLLGSKYKNEMTEMVSIYQSNMTLLLRDTAIHEELLGEINNQAGGHLKMTQEQWDAGVKSLKNVNARVDLNNKVLAQFQTIASIRMDEAKAAGKTLLVQEKIKKLNKWQINAMSKLKAEQMQIAILKKEGEITAAEEARKLIEGDVVREAEADIGIMRLKLEKEIFALRKEYLEQMQDEWVSIESAMFEGMAAGMKKGLLGFIKGEKNLKEALIDIAQGMADAMANRLAEIWTEKLMDLIFKGYKTKEQIIKEKHILDMKEIYDDYELAISGHKAIIVQAGKDAIKAAQVAGDAIGIQVSGSLEALKTKLGELNITLDIPEELTKNTAATIDNTEATWQNSDALEPVLTDKERQQRILSRNPGKFTGEGKDELKAGTVYRTAIGDIEAGVYGDKAKAIAKLDIDKLGKEVYDQKVKEIEAGLPETLTEMAALVTKTLAEKLEAEKIPAVNTITIEVAKDVILNSDELTWDIIDELRNQVNANTATTEALEIAAKKVSGEIYADARVQGGYTIGTAGGFDVKSTKEMQDQLDKQLGLGKYSKAEGGKGPLLNPQGKATGLTQSTNLAKLMNSYGLGTRSGGYMGTDHKIASQADYERMKTILGQREFQGIGGEQPGMMTEQSKLAEQALIELNKNSKDKQSLYVHDTHLEELLKSIIGKGTGEPALKIDEANKVDTAVKIAEETGSRDLNASTVLIEDNTSKIVDLVKMIGDNMAGGKSDMFGELLDMGVQAVMAYYGGGMGGGGGGSGGGGGVSPMGGGMATGGYVTKKGIQHFAGGGRAKGKDTVPAMLSPGEYVLTPQQMKAVSTGSTNVTVNMAEGGSSTIDTQDGAEFGKAIATVVNAEIIRQQRPGGTLNKTGGRMG